LVTNVEEEPTVEEFPPLDGRDELAAAIFNKTVFHMLEWTTVIERKTGLPVVFWYVVPITFDV
jgi:hypothetical protein